MPAFYDMPLEQMRTYKPDPPPPADFDAFWQTTLDETRSHPLDARFEAADFGLHRVDTYDVSFNGYGGQSIKGWLLLPQGASQPLPCIVEYLGYGGGRGFPTDHLLWASAGYAHFVMDTRGQGSVWSQGVTPDMADGGGPTYPGFMTHGILDPKTYYYRRMITDAVRAVEAARSHPLVDADRIAVTGDSQGGGITIAVSGLVPDVALSMPNVPSLSDWPRSIGLTDRAKPEIVGWLATHREHYDQVMQTLAYFDNIHFAKKCRAACLFSTGLMDPICPPSTVFAAYNHITSPKEIEVYRFNGHEGGGPHHRVRQVAFVNSHWADYAFAG